MDEMNETPVLADSLESTLASDPAVAPAPAAELFVSDIHGEYEAFSYAMRSGCGTVREAVDEAFGDLASDDALSVAARRALVTLVCYPAEKMERELPGVADQKAWLSCAAYRLLEVLRRLAGHRGAQELLDAYPADAGLAALLAGALANPLDEAGTGEALGIGAAAPEDSRAVIVALAETIQRLAVGAVHMVGDVYDRGPAPDLVMDELERWPKLDVQWGNHDILWMGAALGQPGSVANAVRICARYANLSILRDTYGIDISPLVDFALSAYADDPCAAFGCKGPADVDADELALSIKVQKAIAIIQFKAEARLIAENPSFGLEARNLLDKIDYDVGTVVIDGQVHELLDKVFPTVDPADPFRMTDDEQRVLEHLQREFVNCERLQRHMRLFLEKGSLYKVDGDILLFHACVPLNADGTCMETSVLGAPLAGRALFDAVDACVRDAFGATDPAARKRGMDLLWYLWLGKGSPLFAKSKMATFELYYVADKATRKEVKNPFYSLLEDEGVIDGILEEFGMDPSRSRIVCGHVPVKVKDGEDPVKCGGKIMIIDGGMSRAYQSTTGVAGFALRRDGRGLSLASLEPFCGTEAAVEGDLELGMAWRTV